MKITARQADILVWLLDNPQQNSNTAVYVNTSPSCLRRGLKRSMGTDNWTTPRSLTKKGLVQIVVAAARESKRVPGFMRPTRYAWSLTEAGLRLAKEIKNEKTSG